MSCEVVSDIEDILKQDGENEFGEYDDIDTEDFSRANNKAFIVPRVMKQRNKKPITIEQEENEAEEEAVVYNPFLQTNVPGVASIYVKTWGCTHNNSDSEYMAGQLAAYGYKLVGNIETKT
jgi:threonylcarbamoyladenosine tRNA methylthiotransferase CDKAL1